MRGWVYVMTCRAMPGLLKVGASTKDPFLRAKELRTTGNPHEFVVEYDVLAQDPFMLERAVHERLSHHREISGGQGSEFFRCAVEEAVVVIRSLTKGSGTTDTFHKAQREAVLAAERAEAERAAERRHLAAEALKLQKDEARRREQAELLQQRHEELERERLRLAQERIEKRKEWEADQKSRLYKSFKDQLVRARGLEMLATGTLVICTSCNRPLLFSSPIATQEVVCDACRGCVVIPRR